MVGLCNFWREPGSEGNFHTEFKVAELMCLTLSPWLQEDLNLKSCWAHIPTLYCSPIEKEMGSQVPTANLFQTSPIFRKRDEVGARIGPRGS